MRHIEYFVNSVVGASRSGQATSGDSGKIGCKSRIGLFKGK